MVEEQALELTTGWWGSDEDKTFSKLAHSLSYFQTTKSTSMHITGLINKFPTPH